MLKLVSFTNQLSKTFPLYDYTLIYQTYITISYLMPLFINNNDENYTALSNFNLILKNQLTNTTYDSSVKLTDIVQIYSISVNLFSLFNNLFALQNNNQQLPYTSDLLAKSNEYIYNTVLNGPIGVADNILNKVKLLRNNFISQYFYYVKYENSIINIYNSGLISNDFTFTNITQIAYGILSLTNYNNVDLTLLQNISSLVFIYPELFPDIIAKIALLQTSLDDFSNNITKLVTPYLSQNYVKRLTFKDVYDIINFTFYQLKNLCMCLQQNNIY
ncbi:MAG: hypothetical protein EOP34_07345, partial [Rickettsiales bacterium]